MVTNVSIRKPVPWRHWRTFFSMSWNNNAAGWNPRFHPEKTTSRHRTFRDRVGARKQPQIMESRWTAIAFTTTAGWVVIPCHGRLCPGLLDYANYGKHGLAIGSGTTETAGKTAFAYRLEHSGMKWYVERGQV